MTDKACLSIGIVETKGLDYLPGAVNGAKAFDAWARKSGYATELVTDEDEAVTIDRIRAALLRLLPRPRDGSDHGGPRNPPARLLLYFAGHGMAKDAYEDLWLLSNTYNDQKAVAISALWRKLHTYKVPQIGIFSDACRSPAARDWNFDLVADAVLPLGPQDPSAIPTPHVDQFKASSKLRQAFMLPGASDAESRCIFTGVLLEALHGVERAAFDKDYMGITSQSLANYLDQAVPARAKAYKVEMIPDTSSNFRPNNHFYLKDPSPEFPALPPWPVVIDAPAGQGPGDEDLDGGVAGLRSGRRSRQFSVEEDEAFSAGEGDYFWQSWETMAAEGEAEASARTQKADQRGAQFLQALRSADRPDHFETSTGLSVSGGEAVLANVRTSRRSQPSIGHNPNWWRVGLPMGGSDWVLAELADGRFLGGAVMHGFITDFMVDPVGCAGMVVRRTDMPMSLAAKAEEALAAIHSGQLVSGAAHDLALEVRDGKHDDPVLGVLAAYLYDALGDIDDIRRLAWFYIKAEQAIPYDIALLGLLPSEWRDGEIWVSVPALDENQPRTAAERNRRGFFTATDAAEGRVAGRFPWMRQGWPLLSSLEGSALVPEGLLGLQAHLAASPFTALSQEGGRALIELLEGTEP